MKLFSTFAPARRRDVRKADGDDVLTPLMEEAANAILVDVTKK